MKKFLKDEKGGVTLYVLMAMFLMIIILSTMYAFITNKQSADLETAKQIKETYEQDLNNIDGVYNNLISK